jgi:4-nitrophenyl phosphatase
MSPSAIRLPQLVSAEHIWKAFDTFLFDADGVLWREKIPLESAVLLTQKLFQAGKRVLVVTNNSTRDSNEHAEKCRRMGFAGFSILILTI